MFAKVLWRFGVWLSRKRLARDTAWRIANDNEIKARKLHRSTREFQAAKRERIHTALGWRGSR